MEQKEKLLQLFREGKLSLEEQTQLEEYIASGTIAMEELDRFSETMDFLDTSELIPAGSTMDSRFYASLESQKTQQNNFWNISSWWSTPWRFAIPAALAVLLFWGGMQCGMEDIENPVAIPKQNNIASILSAEDVSDKIHLVSSTKIEDETDHKIIEALLFTLNNDESNNVRLACIDVLMNYSYLPIVRAGLVSSISYQNSPVVLANLAEAIEASGKKLDKTEFRSRIKKDLPPPIKRSMEEVLTQL